MIIQDISMVEEMPLNTSRDYTKEQFENCIPLKRIKPFKEDKSRHAHWLCQCKLCGNYFETSSNTLKNNHIGPSCGCKQKQIAAKHITKVDLQRRDKPKDDLTGQKFGLLTILSFSHMDKNRHSVWNCKCECGTEKQIIRNELISGDTKSCGCLHQSFGSYKIEQILNQYNIPFEKEKTFETCRFPDTKEKGRFDFFINGKLVEFDGKQHYEFVGGYFTQQSFKALQQRDKYKNQWCKDNNIELIRIPYTDENLISLEYLKEKGVI